MLIPWQVIFYRLFHSDKLRVQTATFIGHQPNLLPVMFSPELRLEADVVLFTYWWMPLFRTSNSCLWCITTACAPSGWWVHFDGGPPCMIQCSTTQLMPFQYKLHGSGPTCGCYVNSSLHLFSCPAISNHVKKRWNHSAVCPPPHACCFIDCCAMPAAPCTVIFQTSGICAPVTAVL